MKKFYFVAILAILFSTSLFARTQKESEQLLRKADSVLDLQQNTVSNFQLYTTNYGITGLDVKRSVGGGFWPRGSINQYLFGSGFWFGAEKNYNGTTRKLVEVSYDPQTGKSWFVPGSIADGDNVQNDDKNKYRVYFSTEFDKSTGVPLVANEFYNWPLWLTYNSSGNHKSIYEYGYEYDASRRNSSFYPVGPAILSDEDIVSVFKDTDLSAFDDSASRTQSGYPLRLQCESRIYSWKDGNLRDVIIQVYLIKNMSGEELHNCWFGGMYDIDIARAPNTQNGSQNDRARFYDNDPSLNLGLSWTNTDRGEKGNGFGYIGISMLETPAVDEEDFIRNDKQVFDVSDQIGLVTYKNIMFENDPVTDAERYYVLSCANQDSDKGPGDTRLLMSTGPFNMRPGDVARVAFAICLAKPAVTKDANGSDDDMAELIRVVKAARKKYAEQLLVSVPENMAAGQDGLHVYPNPVSNMLNITYNMKNTGNVRISLVNNLGVEMMELFRGIKEQGTYNERFALEGSLSGGIYFIKLETGTETVTGKIVIAR